jgi:hypothetical protein
MAAQIIGFTQAFKNKGKEQIEQEVSYFITSLHITSLGDAVKELELKRSGLILDRNYLAVITLTG